MKIDNKEKIVFIYSILAIFGWWLSGYNFDTRSIAVAINFLFTVCSVFLLSIITIIANEI